MDDQDGLPRIDGANSEALLEDEVEQIIEVDGNEAPDRYGSDDEDQQSTSNMSGVEEHEVMDDSRYGLQAHDQDCFTVAVSGDRWLASGGEDDKAFLWDKRVSEADPVLKLDHADSVTNVCFNAAGTLLASGDMSGKIVITDLATLKSRADLNDANDLEWMFWHPSSDILFAGDKDGMLWMWLVGAMGIAQSKVYAGSGTPCTVGQLLPDGKQLLAGYSDGSLRLWALRDQTSISVKFRSPITSIHYHANHSVTSVGTENGYVHIVTICSEGTLKKVTNFAPLDGGKKPAEEGEEEDVSNCVECVQLCPWQQWLAAGRNDGSLCVYELDAHCPRFIFRSPQGQAIVRTLWVMEGKAPLLVTGSIDGVVRIFDGRNGSMIKEQGNGGDEVLDLLVLEQNPLRIMTAGSGGVVRIFYPFAEEA